MLQIAHYHARVIYVRITYSVLAAAIMTLHRPNAAGAGFVP